MQQVRNFQKELDRLLQRTSNSPRLLLHSCCGPCSAPVLEYLTQFFEVTLLWFNPNLFPEEEFHKRLHAQLELIEKMGLQDLVHVIELPWRSEEYYNAVTGLENEPEGGKRCTECFRLRLRETAQLAVQGGYDYFCSTLTLSRHKDALRINHLGEELAQQTGAVWLPSDFKKHNREARSLELCEQHGIYRQLYCGCEFSLQKRQSVAAEKAAQSTLNAG